MLVEERCAEIARICYPDGRAPEIAVILEEARKRSNAYGWSGSESLDSVLYDLKKGRKFIEGG
jgi:hypothetical protein